MEEEKFEAQFHDSNFEFIKVKGKSIQKLKKKLSKMDVLASAYIYEIENPDNHCYYKPMYQNRKK